MRNQGVETVPPLIAKRGMWSLYRIKGTIERHGTSTGGPGTTLYNHLEIGEVVFERVAVPPELERTTSPGTTGIYYVAYSKWFFRVKVCALVGFKDQNNEIVVSLTRVFRPVVDGALALGLFMLLLAWFIVIPALFAVPLLYFGLRRRIGMNGIHRVLKNDMRAVAQEDPADEWFKGVRALARSV